MWLYIAKLWVIWQHPMPDDLKRTKSSMNHFRARLRQKELLLGTMITLDAPEVSEVLAAIGFDWLFIDTEHAPVGPTQLRRILQATGEMIPCIVRLPEAQEVPIKQALDVGAAGIIAPMVNTREKAEAVVRWARYSPQGSRGVGIGRAHGYGLKLSEYIERANDEIVVVVQAEHTDAVHHIDEIIQVPGVDAVLVGPYDLSASLNRLGQLTDPSVIEAVDHITKICQENDMPLGIFGLNSAAVQPYIGRGYTLIVVGVDTLLLAQAAKQILDQLKSSP
jgi:2-dehydro-3-deoxyglucarate aldolase